jgi:hypothetical protein
MRRTPHKYGLFPDVVAACKGLIKEKEALEASLKALTGSSTSDKSSEPGNKTSSGETESEEINANSAFTSEVGVIKSVYITILQSAMNSIQFNSMKGTR